MKKVLYTLLSLLLMVLVVNSNVSANDSFIEGETRFYCSECTVINKTYTETGIEKVDAILSNPSISKLRNIVSNIPSDANYNNYLVNFFEVSNECEEGNGVEFTVYDQHIISGAVVKAVHYSTHRGMWELVPAASVNTSNNTAVIQLQDSSPVGIIISIPKTQNAPRGVVDTATK